MEEERRCRCRTNIEVMLGCTKTSAIKYETDKALFEIDLLVLVLQKLNKILVPNNPPDDGKNIMCNINMEEIKKDGLAGKKGSSRTKCCLSKTDKLAEPAKVALLQSANIWVGNLEVSFHCTNDRSSGGNTHEGSGTDTIGAHGEAMTASRIMDIARTWCIQFGKKQSQATLKDVQYNLNFNFNMFNIGKAIKEGWKLSGDQEDLVLIKDRVKLVFDIKIMSIMVFFSVCTCGGIMKLVQYLLVLVQQ